MGVGGITKGFKALSEATQKKKGESLRYRLDQGGN